MRFFITGANGFVGRHVVEAALRRGYHVSAIVRSSEAVEDLKRLGVAAVPGDFHDSALLRNIVPETDVVVHCAAKVGDWGPHDEYRPVNVEGLRRVLDACKGQALARFIHISSLGVYPTQHHYGTDETMPISLHHRDGYSQTKAEADQLARQYYQDFGVPVVVLRPGFIYGPQDRTVLPRIIQGLREGRVRYPGQRGARALNTIFVTNLVDAIFLAISHDDAVGETYNLTDGETVSKRQFFETVADGLGLPRPTLMPPYWLAWLLTWCSEHLAKLRGAKDAPQFNFTRFKFLARNLDFSIEKARRELEYKPRYRFSEGMTETLAWYKTRNP